MSNVWLGGEITAFGNSTILVGGQQIIISNALIVASSKVLCGLLTDDATAKSVVAVCTTGQVIIRANAVATAACNVVWALLG